MYRRIWRQMFVLSWRTPARLLAGWAAPVGESMQVEGRAGCLKAVCRYVHVLEERCNRHDVVTPAALTVGSGYGGK
ncbi:hypothetical protein HDV62DRAFT_172287 [Trichoderma sp. SZMC 28011]